MVGPAWAALVPLDLLALTWLPLEVTPTAGPVYPTSGSGFAAYIVGGFFVLGVLVLFMIWTSRPPKSRRPPAESPFGDLRPPNRRPRHPVPPSDRPRGQRRPERPPPDPRLNGGRR
jgi:hypothetical protein